MKSYLFPVKLERDGEEWHASIPSLGISARGSSWRDVLRQLQHSAQAVVERMLESSTPFPADTKTYDSYSVVVNLG